MFKNHLIKSNNRALIPMSILSILDFFGKKANNVWYTKSIVWVHGALAIQQTKIILYYFAINRLVKSRGQT